MPTNPPSTDFVYLALPDELKPEMEVCLQSHTEEEFCHCHDLSVEVEGDTERGVRKGGGRMNGLQDANTRMELTDRNFCTSDDTQYFHEQTGIATSSRQGVTMSNTHKQQT